jgi:hypothetical protein
VILHTGFLNALETKIEGYGDTVATIKPWNIGPADKVYLMIKSKNDEEFIESPDGKIVPLFWSNEDGWVMFFHADRWHKFEYFEVDLPGGGEWVQVDCVSNYTSLGDHYVCHDIYQVTENPVVYPDSFDGDNYFRAV